MIAPIWSPKDTFDWISPADLANLAQNAYNAACRESCPDPDEDFIHPDTGQPWADRADFHRALLFHLDQNLYQLFEERVIHKSTAACAEGVPAFLRAVATEGRCGPCG